jgi:pyruvate dehydrogenase E2 component (dihydrolipoamide acetyltransferase)
MAEFRMPSLGADMDVGTLVEWLVKPGDRVKHGDIVAVVETQKGAIEIEVFETGEVENILVDLGTEVPVGTPLARIRTDAEAKAGLAERLVSPGPVAVSPSGLPVTMRPSAPPPMPKQVPPAAITRRRASPAARRLAVMRNIDLAAVVGTGPGGAILLKDVDRRLGPIAVSPEGKSARGLDLDAMRVAIAAAMVRSKREIPHYYLEHQVDVTAAEAWLARTNAGRAPDERLLMGAVIMKAVAWALRQFPAFNGFFREGKFEPASAIHVGMAISIRGGGLAAPAIRDTDKLSCDDLMMRLRDLVQRMRAGRIRSSEIADATITVSSLGERGVETLYGVIYPPQVALVAFGKIAVRPWVVGEAVVPRSIMTTTISGDHRVSDGHAGALFLAEIDRLMQEPNQLCKIAT